MTRIVDIMPVAGRPLAVVRGNNRFALDLYARLRDQAGNLFFSPYSISAALSMTYAGARGQTADQMAAVLRFPLDQRRLHRAFGVLNRELQGEGELSGQQLYTANYLWGRRGYGFVPRFLKLLRNHYGAGLAEVDFIRAPEATLAAINAWVEEQTQGKIKDFLKPEHIDSVTVLILTNAIYFKGDWARQFQKRATTEQPFLMKSGQQVTVSMMRQTGQFKYLEEDDFQALELPYGGERLSMVVLLPRKVGGLPRLEQELVTENLAKWLTRLQQQRVVVELPKFRVTTEFELSQVLADMGMPLAFSPAADFSGMNGGKGPLAISRVIHKALVDVNEEGTEAAAATAVAVLRSAVVEQPRIFRADHPFIIVVRDTRSGSILFLGRVINPQLKEE